jgi:uncharacterized protein (DUF488 family)
VQYDRIAELPAFTAGLERVIEGAEEYRIALMCSEKDPITCHRMLLVGRALSRRGVDVQHILADGRLESQSGAEYRMCDATGVPHEDLFESQTSLLDRAYDLQSQACAFALRAAESGAPAEGMAL